MIDVFWWYTITLVFVCIMGLLMVLYRLWVGNKYTQAEQRLRIKLNEATSYFKGNSEKAPEFIGKAIGGLGVEGIMEELGIDAGILKNPLVRGLIDKYAPKVLEQLSKNANTETKETGLL
jgi:hypothetical protein